ncbi:unnamed protein product, partial [Nesidiocoris tenuis]
METTVYPNKVQCSMGSTLHFWWLEQRGCPIRLIGRTPSDRFPRPQGSIQLPDPCASNQPEPKIVNLVRTFECKLLSVHALMMTSLYYLTLKESKMLRTHLKPI